jgi:sigma-B regulation protein RsbU (phosphoserine phosphatase)
MDQNGTARYIERGGVPLGMFRDSRYYEYYLSIEPGHLLVIYTDGVTEAMSPDGEEYGRQRLEKKVREARHLTARELIKFVQRDVLSWTGERGAGDDITLFVIKAGQPPEGVDILPDAPLLQND